MKIISRLSLVSAVMATSMYASNFSVKIGVENVNFDKISDSAKSITLVNSKANNGFATEVGFAKGDRIGLINIKSLYNWKIVDHLYLGANIGYGSIFFNKDKDYKDMSFTEFTYGGQVKYAINKNHSLDIGYSTGSATTSSGVVSFDVDITTFEYSYRF